MATAQQHIGLPMITAKRNAMLLPTILAQGLYQSPNHSKKNFCGMFNYKNGAVVLVLI